MSEPSPEPARRTIKLSVWDAVSIIVGIVVGTSIFKVPGLVCSNVSSTWEMVAVWALGGVLSLFGAMCYAELATTYPRSGGDYVYLTRAFGSWMGFLFGWAQLAVILTGSTGTMAFAFADYAAPLFSESSQNESLITTLAVLAIVVLTGVNLLGAQAGKWTQNILSVCKVLGLGGIIWAGLFMGSEPSRSVTGLKPFHGFGMAMIFVLYAYGGWNDAAFVASEVHDRKKNIPRALFYGIGGITVLYILVNLAYVWGLGFETLQSSFTPASQLMEIAFGDFGGRAMNVIVVISALGAINGLTFAGSRVYSSLGEDHRLFGLLGRWNSRLKTPVWALVAHGLITILLILAVGTSRGRYTIDQGLLRTIGKKIPWEQYFGGFDTLVAGTAPVFWLFFLLTGLALFILRIKDRDRLRPFRVLWYPVTPVIFCLTSIYMLYSSLTYAKYLTLLGLVPLVLGVPLYLISGKGLRPDGLNPEEEEAESGS